MKGDNLQKALPRIRSVQYFICEICGKMFYPNLLSFVAETLCLCPTQGHKYGRRKPTEKSVFEFFQCVNSSLEELIKIKAIFILRQGMCR